METCLHRISTRLLHINEIEWIHNSNNKKTHKTRESKNVWEIVCGAKDEITKPTIMFFVLALRSRRRRRIRKKAKFKADFVDDRRKGRKVSRRLLEKSQLFVFMEKSAANLKSISKVSNYANIRYEKHLSGTAAVWMDFNWKRIYRCRKSKRKNEKNKEIQLLNQAANRSKGYTK